MVWPIFFLVAGGAAFAVRGALRAASRSGCGGPQGAPRGLGAPQWMEKLNERARRWKQQMEGLTRDLRGFEAPMSRSEAYQILKLSYGGTEGEGDI